MPRRKRRKWKFIVVVRPPKKLTSAEQRAEFDAQLERFARALLALVADTSTKERTA
jgi:hypothetical protein